MPHSSAYLATGGGGISCFSAWRSTARARRERRDPGRSQIVGKHRPVHDVPSAAPEGRHAGGDGDLEGKASPRMDIDDEILHGGVR